VSPLAAQAEELSMRIIVALRTPSLAAPGVRIGASPLSL
jgi:hypothetical protein